MLRVGGGGGPACVASSVVERRLCRALLEVAWADERCCGLRRCGDRLVMLMAVGSGFAQFGRQ
eukprot:5737384-Pyramimonas_sp.AAC.1